MSQLQMRDDDLNPYKCPACLVRSETVAENLTDDPERITCFCRTPDCRVRVFSNRKDDHWGRPGWASDPPGTTTG